MRVGSFVYATDQGLGILAKSFYDAGVLTDVMVVRHGTHPTHDEWYPYAQQIANLRTSEGAMQQFCSEMDAMLFFETPFWWPIVDWCNRNGVKTVIMPMHECMPERIPAQPNLWLCPSMLDVAWAAKHYSGKRDAVHLPVPVSVPWRQRTKAEVFVHNAGHGGLKGRNGTRELLEALQYVKSPIKLILRSQEPLKAGFVTSGNVDVEDWVGDIPYELLWVDGDVFIFPERHNGLSLPLQEARAAGMLVMAGNRFPVNRWLPTEPLIPVASYVKSRIGPPYSEFDAACYDPKEIAATIDAWFGKDISEYSRQGKEWAEENSWDVLRSRYLEVLANA